MPDIEDLKQKRIAVVCGGWSSEREVSLRSGEKVFNALKKKGYQVIKIDLDRDFVQTLKKEKIEFVYNILHGCPGEDGTIQGMLDLLQIPYTGSGVLGSAMAMNKIVTKQLFAVNNIPTPAYVIIRDKVDMQAIERLGDPIIFKPYAEGSSVGVIKYNSIADFKKEIDKLLQQYSYGIVEKYLQGMAITIGVLENKTDIRALPILELVSKNEFYDYEAKYSPGKTEFILPARLDESLTRKAQELAVRVHQVLWCYGVSRVDMIVVDRDIYVLEVNSLPGMTDMSDLPAEAKAEGISYEDLVEQIAISGYQNGK